MKIALAMIVKPDDSEAIVLERCLESVWNHVDGIYITQAGPKKNTRVSAVAKEYAAVESFFKWNDSFADARNFNFSQVPPEYDYIFWLDADDIVRGVEKLREIIEQNKNVDAFSLWYLYAFDEWKNPVVVHHKTRVIKNDGCVVWAGNLHEDFHPQRDVIQKHIEGVEVLHLTNADRLDASKKRNEKVAKTGVKANPNDPRSYWNLGNSLKSVGKDEEALEAFNTFLATSFSEDEKYIARMRRAECFEALGNKEKALDELRAAIGLKYEYPDAYIQLGRVYNDMGRFSDAIPVFKHALSLPPPIYKIMVFNPRDYDIVPLKHLSVAYLAMHQPSLALECLKAILKVTPKDEKLQEIIKNMTVESDKFDDIMKEYARIKDLPKDEMKIELDKLPEKYKSAPVFTNLRNVNFIKTESSGKDMAILCGFTERTWDATAVEEGIGGSEEAVINLSKRFQKKGWNVTVYNNCGHQVKEFDGVKYAPFWTWNYRDKQDVTILWRHPKMADYDINSTKVYLDLHDVIKPGEFTPNRLKKIDKIFVKSKFHRSLFPDVPDDKFVVIPNGIEYETLSGPVEKDPFLLINTSSPDRSLSALIKLFKRVKEKVPEAKCEWAYGWGVFDAVHGKNHKIMEWKAEILKDMEEAGIVNRGRLSHKEIAEMYKRARIFAYPTEFAEIDCISARKAQAAGAIPVTTDFAALNETVQYGNKVHSKKTKDDWSQPYQFDFALNDEDAEDKWVACVVAELKGSINEHTKMREAMSTYDWDKITDRWLNEMVCE